MAFVLNTLLLIGQLAVYGVLLLHPRISRALAPLLHERDRPSWRDLMLGSGWASKAWRRRRRLYTENLDATVMVRFCILGVKFSAAGTVTACVLIPIYATGEGKSEGFNNFHLSNLELNNDHFWVVVLAAYVLAGIFLHLTADEWRFFIGLRRRHFERLAKGARGAGLAQAQRSILIESVPEAWRQQDGSGVRRFFEERLFPGQVLHSCVLHADTRQLHKDPAAMLRGAGEDTVKHLRHSLGLRAFDAHSSASATPCHDRGQGAATPSVGIDVVDVTGIVLEEAPPEAETVEAAKAAEAGKPESGGNDRCCAVFLEPLESAVQASIELGRGIARRTWQAAEVMQDLSIGSAGSSTAFVTMGSVADRIIAEQLVLSHSGYWEARAAPEATDIIWRNAAMPLNARRTRTLLSDCGLILGLVFWSAPVASLQAWTSLEDPRDLHESSWVRSQVGVLIYTFLREYLPVLTLLALQYALPMAIAFISREYEGWKVKSDIARRALQWNFRYQFVTLYITVISGTVSLSFHDQLGEVLQNPQAVFAILREEVPEVASYFINYVSARVGITVPMLLFFPLLSNLQVCRRRRRQDEEEEPAGLHPVYPDFAIEPASLGLVLVLGLTYSVIAPSIMPVCMLFFAFAFLVYCWLFSFVYTPEFDALGACWYELYETTILGLLLGTLSLAALASAFKGFHSAEFNVLLLLCAGIVGAYVYMHYAFALPSRYISLEDACRVDRACDPVVMKVLLNTEYYIDPILRHSAHAPEEAAPTPLPSVPLEEDEGQEEDESGTEEENPPAPVQGGRLHQWMTGSLGSRLSRSSRAMDGGDGGEASRRWSFWWLCGGCWAYSFSAGDISDVQ